METKNKIIGKRNIFLLEDMIFYLIIIPLIIVVIIIMYKRIEDPNKIPDIFGYKMFIILDDNMDKSIKYGDLVFTHNIEPKNLEQNDLIAFRNNTNKVTVHRIIKITEDNVGRQFEMQNSKNEIGDTKYVRDEQVEGIIIYRIPKIGLILFKIQEPYIILSLIGIVILVGIGDYYIAEKLDKRNMKKTK